MYAEEFFFSPNTDLVRLIPLFTFLAITVIIILIVAFAIYYRRWELSQKKDLHNFRSHAADYGLEKLDIQLLMRWARWAKIGRLTRLLTNVEAFEKLVKRVERKGKDKHKKLGFSAEAASRIRVQLYGKDIASDQTINTTYDLRPGLRLFLRYMEHKNTAVWAHLVDIEEDGLIVAVPNKKEIKVPLRPETKLEITAYIPKHEPVTFNTSVKKAIPGPRRMVVVEHSSFMIPKKSKVPTMPSHIQPLVANSAML